MELLRMLETIRSPFLDTVIGLITRLGEEAVVLVIMCAIYWCINKKAAYRIGIAFFFSGITAQGMKICFRIDRPWIVDPTLNPVPSALGQATSYSFPSGHAQSAAALFGSLGVQIKRKPIKAACFIVIALVAFSRMYLGVHTLLDVAVSIAVSLLFVLLTVLLFTDGPSSRRRELIIAVFMVLYCLAAVAIASVLYFGGTIEEKYLSDCLKAAGAGFGYAVGIYIERVYICFSVKAKNLLYQIIKFAIGIAGVLVIMEGMKLLFGTGLVLDTVRYFLMIIWITVLFPLIIKRFFVPLN